MTENTVYRCDVCGTTYANRNDCVACEVFHARLSTGNVIENVRYLAKNNGHLPYPHRVTLRFSDGRFACYEYCADVTPRR